MVTLITKIVKYEPRFSTTACTPPGSPYIFLNVFNASAAHVYKGIKIYLKRLTGCLDRFFSRMASPCNLSYNDATNNYNSNHIP